MAACPPGWLITNSPSVYSGGHAKLVGILIVTVRAGPAELAPNALAVRNPEVAAKIKAPVTITFGLAIQLLVIL